MDPMLLFLNIKVFEITLEFSLFFLLSLFIHLSIYIFVYPSFCLYAFLISVCLYISTYLFFLFINIYLIHQSICLSVRLPLSSACLYMSIYLLIYLSVCMPVCLSLSHLSVTVGSSFLCVPCVPCMNPHSCTSLTPPLTL